MGYILIALGLFLFIYSYNRRSASKKQNDHDQYEDGILDYERKAQKISIKNQYGTEAARESIIDEKHLEQSPRDRSDEKSLDEEIEGNSNQ
ncbi:hypothetical protein [Haloplasma contractile]|uniref:Uncharacterized protein n=1 Tax=Haloplasma contractile SSD-17B TaxID=1033810 RepID=U2DXW6_9MOLU|nr:hypothetical protein [Haloplasma contractile]ERJ13107.1 hypothetical protein HLPCO_000721 [Haloplasma contractile SSD-17B]